MDNQIKKDKIDGACSSHKADDRSEEILLEEMNGRDYLVELDVDGKIILKQILKKLFEYMDWIHPSQHRNQWQELESTAINLQVPLEAGNLLTS
jgi:hypothetical protein